MTSASASTLDTQIATTQRLREEFERDPSMTQSSVRLRQRRKYDNACTRCEGRRRIGR